MNFLLAMAQLSARMLGNDFFSFFYQENIIIFIKMQLFLRKDNVAGVTLPVFESYQVMTASFLRESVDFLGDMSLFKEKGRLLVK